MQVQDISTYSPSTGVNASAAYRHFMGRCTPAPRRNPDKRGGPFMKSPPADLYALIPIVGGWVAVRADEAGDLLCWHTVRYRGRAVPEQATDAELQAELGALLFEHGMTGMREAAHECSWELRHGEPDDVADVRRWREIARRLAAPLNLAGASDLMAVAR